MLYFSADESRSSQTHAGPNIILWHKNDSKFVGLVKWYKVW